MDSSAWYYCHPTIDQQVKQLTLRWRYWYYQLNNFPGFTWQPPLEERGVKSIQNKHALDYATSANRLS